MPGPHPPIPLPCSRAPPARPRAPFAPQCSPHAAPPAAPPPYISLCAPRGPARFHGDGRAGPTEPPRSAPRPHLRCRPLPEPPWAGLGADAGAGAGPVLGGPGASPQPVRSCPPRRGRGHRRRGHRDGRSRGAGAPADKGGRGGDREERGGSGTGGAAGSRAGAVPQLWGQPRSQRWARGWGSLARVQWDLPGLSPPSCPNSPIPPIRSVPLVPPFPHTAPRRPLPARCPRCFPVLPGVPPGPPPGPAAPAGPASVARAERGVARGRVSRSVALARSRRPLAGPAVRCSETLVPPPW